MLEDWQGFVALEEADEASVLCYGGDDDLEEASDKTCALGNTT
jgi:hypothetical protein